MKDQVINEDELTFIDYIKKYGSLLLKRWKLIGFIAVIGTTLVLLFCILSLVLPTEINPMPNLYSSYAVLLVDQNTANGGLSSILASYGMALGSGGDGSDNANLILTILQSRQFVDQLADQFSMAERHKVTHNIKTETRKIILRNARFAHDPMNSTLVISYSDPNPVFATEFVNQTIRLLQEWYEEFGGLQTEKELKILEAQLSSQEAQIAVLEEQIKKFQRENNTLSIEDLANLQSSLIGDLRSQKIQIDLQIQTLQQFTNAEIADENLINLRLQRNNIDYLISQLEEGYSGGEKIMPSRDEMPELAIEYAKLQQEALIQGAVYQSLKEQYEIANLNLDRENFFSILEVAEIPEEKDSPSRSTITIAGAFVSLLLGIAIALLIDPLRNLITMLKLWRKDEDA